jgi:hypothetical protein
VALDPAGCRLCDGGQTREDIFDARAADEIGLPQELRAVPPQVNVRVAEARRDSLAGEVDLLCARADEGEHLDVAADGDDPAVADRHCGGARVRGVECDEVPAGEDEVRVEHWLGCSESGLRERARALNLAMPPHPGLSREGRRGQDSNPRQ